MSSEVILNIRALFLSPKATYTPSEAATLLGVSEHEVRKRIAAGEFDAARGDDGPRLPWSELVSFGMDWWSQETIEEALGAELAAGIPELLRLDDLHVRIPRLDILALNLLAVRDQQSVGTVLSHQVRDLTSANSEWLCKQIPDFAETVAWPDVCEEVDDFVTAAARAVLLRTEW